MSEFNPYEKPQTEMLQQEEYGALVIGEHQRVSVAEAVAWIGRGKQMLAGNWGLMIGALLVIVLINIALGFVPIIGDIALLFLMPLLYAGLVHIMYGLDTGRGAEFSDLFAGFSRRSSPLLMMALAQIGVFLLMALVFGILVFAVAGGLNFLDGGFSPALWVLLALLIVAAVIVSFMFYFAVPLIYLGEKGVGDAISLSFYACMANFLPLIIYGLVAILLALLGLLLLGVGLLFVMPILACAYYVSFKDIFLAENSD